MYYYFFVAYLSLFCFLGIIYMKIYEIDKIEQLGDFDRKLVKFRKKQVFICMYSLNKKVVAKNILIYNVINHSLGLVFIVNCVLSIFLQFEMSIVICITSGMVATIFLITLSVIEDKTQKRVDKMKKKRINTEDE